MSRYLSHLAALTLNRVEPVQPRLASRFETPVEMGPSDSIHLDPVHEFQAAPPTHVQPSTVSATDSPVEHKIATAPVNVQAKAVDHAEFMIKKAKLPTNQQKLSSDPGFTSFDKQIGTRVNTGQMHRDTAPVTQTSYAVHKDTQPTESIQTIVERIQERFTETTHNEQTLTEVTASDAHQKPSERDKSTHPTPVRPGSIVVRPEQPTARQNALSQTGGQFVPFATDATPAPTIQVTIGRIEIRATQIADKPAAKPRAANTTMSLEDYLKQRNGGRA